MSTNNLQKPRNAVVRELADATAAVTTFNFQEFLKRLVKYCLEGLAVAVVAYYIPQKKMKMEEIAMIALTAAATFAVLDVFAPSVGEWSRKGAGFGLGAGLVGFPAV